MASIFGLKLKGRRTFQGRDWQGNQGNLYLGNTKIAWYNDSGDGGPADIEYYNGRLGQEQYEPQLEKIVNKYYEKYPMQGEYANLTPDIELLMGELLELMDREKQYKTMEKKGYPAVIIYKESENSPYEKVIGLKTKDAAEKYIAKNKLTKYRLYTSVQEFDIQ